MKREPREKQRDRSAVQIDGGRWRGKRGGQYEYFSDRQSAEAWASGREEKKAEVSAETQSTKLEKDKWKVLDRDEVLKDRGIKKSIFDMIKATYAGIGGHPDFPDPDSVPSDNTDIKLVNTDSDPDPDAVVMGKDTKFGTKLTAMATDGTKEAKRKMLDLAASLLRSRGNYAEVSGKIVDILVSKGSPTVGSKSKAQEVLTGKKIDWHGRHPDGRTGYMGWYNRLIGGHPHEKIMVGKPKVFGEAQTIHNENRQTKERMGFLEFLEATDG